ncbi:hypothetical protein SM999_06550, partial [Escherichia coli]|nr:hypothetical protein [Escherichia coli]
KNNIKKNYNNLMSNWNGTLLLTIINYFNKLINGVSYGARRSIAFLLVIKKIYKREGDVKH